MTISTHVLDTSIGRPAAGLSARLQRLDGADWLEVAQGVTGPDGRIAALVPTGMPSLPGIYRLTFDAGAYFAARRIDAFYVSIPIEFVTKDQAAHYHVPLLLSPHGYTTYRGS